MPSSFHNSFTEQLDINIALQSNTVFYYHQYNYCPLDFVDRFANMINNKLKSKQTNLVSITVFIIKWKLSEHPLLRITTIIYL